MTIGDILAVIAAVALLGASWGATLLLAALAFPAKTEKAQMRIVEAPGACVKRGLGALAIFGTLALVLAQSPVGPVRIVAGALAVGLFIVSAVGGGGIVRLLGERIEEAGTPLAPFAARTRAAVLFVTAGFLPIVGWFLILPASLVLALGAGSWALRRERNKPRAEAASPAVTLEPLS